MEPTVGQLQKDGASLGLSGSELTTYVLDQQKYYREQRAAERDFKKRELEVREVE